jgi:hypothetical protein
MYPYRYEPVVTKYRGINSNWVKLRVKVFLSNWVKLRVAGRELARNYFQIEVVSTVLLASMVSLATRTSRELRDRLQEYSIKELT